MFDSIIDPIFAPFLNLNPLVTIVLLAFLLSLAITLIYRAITDQKQMKQLKDEMKASQKEMKKYKDDPQRMMKLQKKAMEKNMQYMMQSFKPTLVTFIPIIIIFGWLSGHMAWEPLTPGDPFSVEVEFERDVSGEVVLTAPQEVLVEDPSQKIEDGKAVWSLEGEAGEYILEFEHEGSFADKEILVTDTKEYIDPIKKPDSDVFDTITVVHEKLIVMNLFGWQLGWLGTYIIFSLIFSIGLRKLMKIH